MSGLTREIVTSTGEREFEIRFVRDEGIGLLTTREGKDYLILDSVEYWFDSVQQSYPKKRSCVCKNKFFFVSFDYFLREGTEDFRSIRVRIQCSSCSKEKDLGKINFRHSPTQELFDSPITYCPNPRLRCKVRSISGYWTPEDRVRFLNFMVDDLQFSTQCWYWSRTSKERSLETVDSANRDRLFSPRNLYLGYYFSRTPTALETSLVEGGVYVDEDPWRRSDIIELSAPLSLVLEKGIGRIHYIDFAEQYFDEDIVRDKSGEFLADCATMLKWLTESFVQVRGKNCFDSPAEVDRLGL